MRRNGKFRHEVANVQPCDCLRLSVRCLAVALQSDEDPLPHDRKLHRLHAIVVIANRAHAAGIVRSPVTLNCFDPYFNFPTSASLMKLVPA